MTDYQTALIAAAILVSSSTATGDIEEALLSELRSNLGIPHPDHSKPRHRPVTTNGQH